MESPKTPMLADLLKAMPLPRGNHRHPKGPINGWSKSHRGSAAAKKKARKRTKKSRRANR